MNSPTSNDKSNEKMYNSKKMTMKDEFILKKLIISKNKKPYAPLIPLKEANVISHNQ